MTDEKRCPNCDETVMPIGSGDEGRCPLCRKFPWSTTHVTVVSFDDPLADLFRAAIRRSDPDRGTDSGP